MAITIVCIWGTLIFIVVARGLFFYEFNYKGSEVTLTIINHTTKPIQSAEVFNFENRQFVHLPHIPAGGQQKRAGHFWSVEGPGYLTLGQSGGTKYLGLPHVLLNDNGPFEFVVTVESDHVHVQSWAASKGSGVYDDVLADASRAVPALSPATKK